MLDIVIIGSGPAGLSAAVYAKRANLNVLVVEKVYYGTGQVAESNRVDNYLGLPGTNGYDLGEKFRAHAADLGVEFKDGEAVSFVREGDVWKVTLKKGEILETKTLIYAAGAVHRHLGVAGEADFGGKGVSYCATCDGAFFKGKTTVVIGGGDTALDDALYLSDLCAKVYLVHRRNEFRGSATTVAKLQEKENVEFVLGAKPEKITGWENACSGRNFCCSRNDSHDRDCEGCSGVGCKRICSRRRDRGHICRRIFCGGRCSDQNAQTGGNSCF